MKLITALLLLVILVMAAKSMFFSFRAQTPADYADTSPAFSLQTHLNGEIRSEGVIFGPTGKMTNSFVARMVGEWDGDTGTLSEEFTYSNGKQQRREWSLKMGANNTFTGTADDIIGEAQGVVSGSTIRMDYQIVLPKESGGHTLTATDWLYLTESGVIMNKSEMRMFGIKVAELIATMRPDPEAQR
ncbi:DUF3833 domain-containing protein [Phaeobacter sp. HF9A]|uniref:DUF3833 domain-containing protein n=1 Tax=Phaeobacter sp. HF9A TaxID=2721561 RepID=UPI00142F6169|nr:DUF3833 domain-containing protein [Phaeobacter sp. HF9A]NIZ12816.1 DUF3833 domain-containing protein [Phaeobacter sp. HF9A]